MRAFLNTKFETKMQSFIYVLFICKNVRNSCNINKIAYLNFSQIKLI